ncbi:MULTISPECIES: hypothetical protein [unclassified Bradyrhizobium]|uniref:hypothetical protein n=1 Tax=Bradyrhizobium sp. USDA 4541 TaxID=2817704 RepID=UPI0020A4F43E|nr:hypothetical protein [Bradyrhizobium sp. USDA 4541]MCP1852845.1 hypothetical protein [Bradyrhizobium sp. USDA 4541]
MTTPADRPNEPTQSALDAFNLSRIRSAQAEAKAANESNNTVKNRLRGVFAITSQQGMNNDAAKLAIKLYEGGDEAIDAYCTEVERAGFYLGLLGKTLSPRQYELFGMRGTGPTPEDERAKREGRAAGFRLDTEPGSKESDNPYETGSIKGQAWLAAFRQARSERDAIMAMPQPTPDGGEQGEGDDGNEA